MSDQTIMVMFAGGSLLLAMLGQTAGLIWKINEIGKGIRDEIAAHQKDDYEEFNAVRREVGDETHAIRREFGEVGAALRTKIQEVEGKIQEIELWSRDHFIHKTPFGEAMALMRDENKASTTRIEMRLTRIEEKQDRAAERN